MGFKVNNKRIINIAIRLYILWLLSGFLAVLQDAREKFIPGIINVTFMKGRDAP